MDKSSGQGDGGERDPVTGLTARDRDAIRSSWAIVKQDLESNGSAFMLRFFDEYPNNQKYFDEFRDLTREQLQQTPGLAQHAMRVMRALTCIVEAIDDAHVLVEIIHNTVDSHLTRSVRAKQFTELFGVFARFLADVLGEQFTSDMATGWQTAAATIMAVVEARVNERLIATEGQQSSSAS